MKIWLLMILTSFSVLSSIAQEKKNNISKPDKFKKLLIVETSCGQCKLGLPGKSCDLAIRINGKSYFVDGTKIDDHGDAHAQDGFCESIRMAKVQGEIKGERFKATYFHLISEKKEKLLDKSLN